MENERETESSGEDRSTKIINWGSFAISIATLILAWVIYCEFGHQQVQSKQIEAVSQLVEYIHNTTIRLEVSQTQENGTASINRYNRTLFELRYDDTVPDSLGIYLRLGEAFPINFNSYVCNPLIPKEIADILSCYYSYATSGGISDSIMNRRSHVYLSNLEFIEEQMLKADGLMKENEGKYAISADQKKYNYYYTMLKAPAYCNWGDFVKYSILLKKAIGEWYKEQGIDNINIRESDYMYTTH